MPREARNQQWIKPIPAVQAKDVLALLNQTRQEIVEQPRRFPMAVEYRQP
jgi:hypothetical protein